MSKIKKVRRSDTNRILLTETLPYEVPILFSNDNFYLLVKNGKLNKQHSCFSSIVKSKHETQPYNYKIKKNIDSSRTISIPHPSIQYQFIDFYESYDSIITSLCSRSAASLRAPTKVASHFSEKNSTLKYKKILRDDLVETKEHAQSKESQHASSYFQYSDFPLLYMFYESYQFQRLERQYPYFLKFDIFKCFQSIYTHSLTWAVKEKKFAKAHRSAITSTSFEGKFDRLMQMGNHGETNGIIVGPEFSRIFSEIILQRVDENGKKQLKKSGIKSFKIRRYVDDYFVFCHSETDAYKIMEAYREELEKFNLHINEAKIDLIKRPFITNESIAKLEAKLLAIELFENYIISPSKSDELNAIDSLVKENKKLIKLDLSYISKYKAIAKSNSVTYESITNIFLSVLRNNLVDLNEKLASDKANADDKKIFTYIKSLVTIAFYCFSMDMRYRPSYLVCQISIVIMSIAEKMPENFNEGIKKTLSDEILLSLRNSQFNNKTIPQELLNLLILHKELGRKYKFKDEVLYTLIPSLVEGSPGDIDYFTAFTTIHYIEEDKSTIKSTIESKIIDRFNKETKPLDNTELFLFFVDSFSCPYLSGSMKSTLMDQMKIKHMSRDITSEEKPIIAAQIRRFLEKKHWFFSWNNEKQVFFNLTKKEMRAPALIKSY
ncbi:antiviral reverse transcriptase Drt3b [Saccharospirillum mangrovi]|uniref:antiviral reverse transcriptase Drt3b n=1 Tax=Saccharospirillum mangrovi TaxID=2161747 RepID=UPI000D36FD0B|nr:antiviral reverse transcriptase Drt3b [Saccharospirillum mangrovi]